MKKQDYNPDGLKAAMQEYVKGTIDPDAPISSLSPENYSSAKECVIAILQAYEAGCALGNFFDDVLGINQSKEIARNFRKVIRSQPPEVLANLSETFTFDDEGRNQCQDIHEAVEGMFDENGYEPGYRKYEKQRLYCWMSLPDILIDIETQTDDEGCGEFKWGFSK